MRAAALGAFALLAILALPHAAAHLESPTQGRALQAGPYTVFLDPKPATIYANATNQQFTLEFGSPPAKPVTATLQLSGPNGFRAIVPFEDYDATRKLAVVGFNASGEHAARLVLEDDEGEYLANLFLTVYPDLPFRVQPADPNLDVWSGESTAMRFETVRPGTTERFDALEGLQVLVMRMSSDHQRVLATQTMNATREDVGLFRLDHAFVEEGHYYLRFASPAGEFNTTDVPLIHLTAITRPPDTGGARTPASPAWALLALAAVAVAWRGRA